MKYLLLPVPGLVVACVAVRYKIDVLHRFFTATENCQALCHFRVLPIFMAKWWLTQEHICRDFFTDFQKLCLHKHCWIKPKPDITISNFNSSCFKHLHWAERCRQRPLSFILQLFHSSPVAQGAPVKTASRIFDRSQSCYFVEIKPVKSTHLKFTA